MAVALCGRGEASERVGLSAHTTVCSILFDKMRSLWYEECKVHSLYLYPLMFTSAKLSARSTRGMS